MVEYVVTKTHNFDVETEAVKFTDYRKATAYLHWYWEDYYNNEIIAQSHLKEDECYHEEDYAKVTWEDGDYTEFNIMEIYPEREDFPEDWERYAM